MTLVRSIGTRCAVGLVSAVVVAACSSGSITPPDLVHQQREAIAKRLDSVAQAAQPGSERQDALFTILGLLQSGAPIDTISFSLNGTTVARPAVASSAIQSLNGAVIDSNYVVLAWSDAVDTLWLFAFNGAPGIFVETPDTVLNSALDATQGAATASAPFGSCDSLATTIPHPEQPSMSCQLQSVTATVSGPVPVSGDTLDILLPSQSILGVRVTNTLATGGDRRASPPNRVP